MGIQLLRRILRRDGRRIYAIIRLFLLHGSLKMPCYLKIALNVPLGLLTYTHPAPLPRGTRVLVPFINKTVAGIV